MQPASDQPPATSRRLRQWGPIAVLVAVLGVVVAVVLAGGGNGDGEAAEVDTADTSADEGSAQPGAPEPTGSMPVTYEEAVEAGTVDDYDWGTDCDTETAKIRLPTVYAAPCVPAFEGDNGGATHNGVTADTITVVRYEGDEGGDLSSLLDGMGVQETPEDKTQTVADYFELYSAVSQTYGREIEVVEYQASGELDDEVASRADAAQIAEQHDPFAVIGGPGLDRGAFASELASRGIACMGCAVAMPDWMAQENAPYNWGSSASAEQFLKTIMAWLGVDAVGELDTGLAEHAGDPGLASQERKIGVVHFEQDPPIYKDLRSGILGTETPVESYLLDLAAFPERSVDIIARMKAEGVTTVIFLGDPVMPIYLLGAATSQDYWPEWIFTGTPLTDTAVFGRQWDQAQMANAFGVAQRAVPTPQELQPTWSLYQWYFGADTKPPAEAQYNVLGPSVARIMRGVHMAGPDLTADTFEQGMFRIPPMGGGPTTTQVSYGDWGFFDAPDYFDADDLAEIWWDADVTGEDEIGREGVGLWRYVDGGRRFTSVDAPQPDPFVVEGTVTSYETLPAADQPPTYPPPAGSPAAG